MRSDDAVRALETRGWRAAVVPFGRLADLRAADELERALRAAGAKDGATVEVGDDELELA